MRAAWRSLLARRGRFTGCVTGQAGGRKVEIPGMCGFDVAGLDPTGPNAPSTEREGHEQSIIGDRDSPVETVIAFEHQRVRGVPHGNVMRWTSPCGEDGRAEEEEGRQLDHPGARRVPKAVTRPTRRDALIAACPPRRRRARLQRDRVRRGRWRRQPARHLGGPRHYAYEGSPTGRRGPRSASAPA